MHASKPRRSPLLREQVSAQSSEPPYTDPYVRWCGRGGAARLPPIPILMGTLSECSQLVHVKVRTSNPGLPSSMCARYICVVHFGHRGRSYMVGFVGVYSNCSMCTSS